MTNISLQTTEICIQRNQIWNIQKSVMPENTQIYIMKQEKKCNARKFKNIYLLYKYKCQQTGMEWKPKSLAEEHKDKSRVGLLLAYN